MKKVRLIKTLLCCIFVLILTLSCALPAAALPAGEPGTVTIEDGAGHAPQNEKRDGTLPDDIRPEEVPGQVAGASDEAPDGMSIFWGIVISLLVAGAVVVGIVMLVPKED